MIGKIRKAASAEEIAGLLRAQGEDEAYARRIWQERQGREDQELSLDELEVVSGGADRNWLTDSCAATVEAGSWCGTNDDCVWAYVTYDHSPYAKPCPQCGGQMYHEKTVSGKRHNSIHYYKCLRCAHVIKTR